MNRIFYMILFFILCIFLIIIYENGDTNLLILDGVTLILCENYLLNIDKDK